MKLDPRMKLDPEKIERQQFATFEAWDELPSTNDRALELANLGKLGSPALIIAKSQTEGRGQRSRQWWSSEESLTFSWCFSCRQAHPLVPMETALCLVEAIEHEYPAVANEIAIKWPNDVLVRGRKVAGILVETVSKNGVTTVIVGIGINVNQETAPVIAVDPSIAFPPTSLRSEVSNSRSSLDQTRLLNAILENLKQRFLGRTHSSKEIEKLINPRISFFGEKISIVQPNNDVIVGFLRGINDKGALRVASIDDPETIQDIYSGTIYPISEKQKNEPGYRSKTDSK